MPEARSSFSQRASPRERTLVGASVNTPAEPLPFDRAVVDMATVAASTEPEVFLFL